MKANVPPNVRPFRAVSFFFVLVLFNFCCSFSSCYMREREICVALYESSVFRNGFNKLHPTGE